jgi:prolyl-tRNA synthetase
MVVLSSKYMDVMGQAVEIAQNIEKTGMDVLLDDRVESAGVKFNDADLIGAPYRVTVSERTLSQNAVELKGRMDPSPRVVPLMDLVYEFHQHKM